MLQGHNVIYPRLAFNDGITDLSNTTANTVVGIMFATVLAGVTREGRELFIEISGEQYQNTTYTFQTLLCFWAWLKKDKYWKIASSKDSLKQTEKAICIMMKKIIDLWPRDHGCEWKKPKFHQCYHNALNIHLFGKPGNWHSGPAEHNHICHVKRISKQTQKRRLNFDWQLVFRSFECTFLFGGSFFLCQSQMIPWIYRNPTPPVARMGISCEENHSFGQK